MIALIKRRREIFPIAEVTIDGPPRPSSTQLTIKPSPGINDFDPPVDVGNSFEYRV